MLKLTVIIVDEVYTLLTWGLMQAPALRHREPFRNLCHLKIHSIRLLFYNWELPSGTGEGRQQFVPLQVSERREGESRLCLSL